MRDKKPQIPINQRVIEVKKVLKKYNISLEQVTGLGSSTVSGFKADRNKPRFDALEKILRNCDNPENGKKLSAEWLMRGEGEMFKSDEKIEIGKDFSETLKILLERNEQKAVQIEALKKELKDILEGK